MTDLINVPKESWTRLAAEPWFIGWQADEIVRELKDLAGRFGYHVDDLGTSDQQDGGILRILALYEPGFVDVDPSSGVLGYEEHEEHEIADQDNAVPFMGDKLEERHWFKFANRVRDLGVGESFRVGAKLFGRPHNVLSPFQEISYDQWLFLCRGTTDWTVLTGPSSECVYSPHYELADVPAPKAPRPVSKANIETEATDQLRRLIQRSTKKDLTFAKLREVAVRSGVSPTGFKTRLWPELRDEFDWLSDPGRRSAKGSEN